jgi:hypothetical protein
VVATRSHIASAADAVGAAPDLVAFASRIRATLDNLFGGTLLTEHGRMAVCAARSTGAADDHCFHAHFLMFPKAPAIDEACARPYFAQVQQARSLEEALGICQGVQGEYFLLSPRPDYVALMTGPGRVPRQLARALVASGLGLPELADWRSHPSVDLATQTAAELRKHLGDRT